MADNLDQLYGADWFENINKTIQLLEKQEGAIKSTNDAMRSLVSDLKGAKGLDDLANGQSKVASTTQQAVAGFDDFNAAIKQAEALKAQYNGSTKEMVAITLTSARATKELALAARASAQATATAERAQRTSAKATEEASNAYKLLVKSHKDAVAEASRLAAEFGVQSRAAKDATKSANELGTKLREIHVSLGNYRDNVGNYSSATNGLRGSMQQLARELPSISNGFQTFASAIGNNIAPAQDAIRAFRAEQEAMRAQGQPTTSLFKALTGAIFNWQTALLLAVTALTVYGKEIGEWVKSLFKGKEALDVMKQSSEALRKSLESTDYKAAVAQVNELRINLELAKKGLLDKDKVLHQYNESIGKTIGQVTGLNEVERKLIESGDAYIRMTLYKAAAQLALEDAAKQSLEAEKARLRTLEDFSSQTDFIGVAARRGRYGPSDEAEIAARRQKRKDEEIKANQDAAQKLIGIAKKFQSDAAAISKASGFDFFSGTQDEKVVKAKKPKKEKDHTKELEEETKRTLSALKGRYEEKSVIEQYNVDNEKKSQKERLAALEKYAFLEISIIKLNGAIQGDTTEEIQARVTEAVLKFAKRRTQIIETEAERQAKAEETARRNLGGISTGGPTQSREQWANEQYEANKKVLDDATAFAYDLASVNSAIAAKRIQEIDEEIVAINKKRDAEIEGIQKSGKSATEKERLIAEAKAKAASKEAELMNERNKRARRAAELEKAINIANIISATALAVVKQLQLPGAGIGLAAITAAMGAAQLAAAIAAPIPGFKDGTDNSPEGLARVSEEGAEMYVTKDGKIGLTPDKETITYLQRGTKIIPHQQTMEIMKHMAIGVPELRQRKDYPMDELLGDTADRIVNAIDRKRFPTSHAQPAWWSAYYAQKTK